ncbi:MAG: ketopantoate reductase family protein [Vicinamibacterales bacterium]
MRTLIVGAGVLGGLIAARLIHAGHPVSLATRDARSAEALRHAGLRVRGLGGEVTVRDVPDVHAVDTYFERASYELVLIATKATAAIDLAPRLVGALADDGLLLPIQNGGVSQLLDEAIPGGRVLGGLSNLGATMHAPGDYEQKNAGHLLIGEVAGGTSERAGRVQAWLGQGVEVRVTPNLAGAVWSKLLINCAVTTLGALAGCPMREYIQAPGAKDLFNRTYDEGLTVALASGATPVKMVVDPVPPGWDGHSVPGEAHDAWLDAVMQPYGGLKPSMLQDIERGRATEIDFINGFVVETGQRAGVATPVNAAIVEAIHAIERGETAPGLARLEEVGRAAGS